MAEVSMLTKGDDCIELPPGFRFHPTDEEIITHYLSQKVMNSSFSARAISEVDLNKCEPWDLPKKAMMGEKEWCFFCRRDRKYPTGMRTNRATEAGYWKATGKDKEIYEGKGCLVGMKKTLVFYRGRAPKGEKTNWVIHEYRLPKAAHAKDEWVVCRVFHKSTGTKRSPNPTGLLRMNSFGFVDDLLLDSPSLAPLLELDFPYGEEVRVLNNTTSTTSHSSTHFPIHQQDHKSFHHHHGNQSPNSIYCPPHHHCPLYSFQGSSKSSCLHQGHNSNINSSSMVPCFPRCALNYGFHCSDRPGNLKSSSYEQR